MNDNEIILSTTIDGLKELLGSDRCETCPQTANLNAEIVTLKNLNHDLEHKCMKAIAERDKLKAKLEVTANECYKCTHEGRLAAAEMRIADLLAFVRDIRGPLYDHDMHDWEDKADTLIEKYGKDAK